MNPAHGEVYSIQHYVIKFVNDLQQDLRSVVLYAGIPISSTNKTDCHDITEILLKVAGLSKILFVFKGYTFRFKSEAFASFASIALRPWMQFQCNHHG
jgi:hypothetical protein